MENEDRGSAKTLSNVYSSSTLSLFTKLKPFLAIILLQFGVAGMAIIGKFALNQGMNHYTFVVYRQTIAAAVFSPFAYFLERKVRPQMTLSIFLKIALLALLEPAIDQNLYYLGMKYTSANFTSAMCNIMPGLAFIMSWIVRLEKVDIKKRHSQAKIIGTIIALGGAMTMTLFRGPVVHLWGNEKLVHNQLAVSSTQQQQIKGAIMITIGCVCWSLFVVLQAITLKSYPVPLSLTSMIGVMGALEASVVAVVAEWGNSAIWSIAFDSKLLAVLYSGFISSGVIYYVQGVIMKERGPVFVTSFTPLSMVIVAILGTFILGEELNLGRIIGAAIIVTGLYLVIWGKSKDLPLSKRNDAQLPIDHQPVKVTNNKDNGCEMLTRKEVPNEEVV